MKPFIGKDHTGQRTYGRQNDSRVVLHIGCLLFLFLLFAYDIHAQWKIITLPNQRHMPVGNVHQTIQDRSGYIWYATDGEEYARDNGYKSMCCAKGCRLCRSHRFPKTLRECSG